MSPTHTFRFKPKGQIPFENAAPLSYINQPRNLNPTNPHLINVHLKSHPKQDSTSSHFKQNSKHIRNPI